MDINTGGSAFPMIAENGLGHISEGMTLRDHFAGKALEGMAVRYDLLGHTVTGGPHTPDAVAKFCYQQADAMLRARETS